MICIFKIILSCGVGGSSVFVLLSFFNKETALDLLIGQNLGRWVKLNVMLAERRQSQRKMTWSHYQQMLEILPCKPLSCGDAQINKDGLNLSVRIS